MTLYKYYILTNMHVMEDIATEAEQRLTLYIIILHVSFL